MNNNVIKLFVIFVIFGFAGWLYVRKDSPSEVNTESHHVPNAFANHIVVIKFNKEGKLESRYESAKLLNYNDKSSVFESPHITLYRTGENPWIIKARYGKAKNGSEIITLWENVRITQQGITPTKSTVITTESINYYPQKNYAETNELITLTQVGMQVRSRGLHANLVEQKFNLLSNAEGRYEKIS